METLRPELPAQERGPVPFAQFARLYNEVVRDAQLTPTDTLEADITAEGTIAGEVTPRHIEPIPVGDLGTVLEREVHELLGVFEDDMASLSDKPQHVRVTLQRPDGRPLPMLLITP